MFAEFQEHFEWRARTLMAGRYDDLASHFVTPLPMQMPGRDLVLKTRDDVVLSLHRLRMALHRHAILQLSVRVVALALPAEEQRVWLRWSAPGSGTSDRISDAIYTLRRSENWLRVCAITYHSVLIPEVTAPSYSNRLANSRA